jgi:hypothetical protein
MAKRKAGSQIGNLTLNIKSWESIRFPCVQVSCNISFKSFQRGLQFCFRPHFNWRSTHKVMGPQSHESPNFENFRTPIWESRDKMSFGCGHLGEHKVCYKGEGGGFPQVRAVVSLVGSSLPVARLSTKSVLIRH